MNVADTATDPKDTKKPILEEFKELRKVASIKSRKRELSSLLRETSWETLKELEKGIANVFADLYTDLFSSMNDERKDNRNDKTGTHL